MPTNPHLTRSDRTWLKQYRMALRAEFPGVVEDLIVYGSKARGEARPDSDLDIVLLVKDGEASRKRPLRRLGYLLAATSDTVPSILVYTQAEWESRQAMGSPFRKAVERDAVHVQVQ